MDALADMLADHPLFDRADFERFKAENPGCGIREYVEELEHRVRASDAGVYRG